MILCLPADKNVVFVITTHVWQNVHKPTITQSKYAQDKLEEQQLYRTVADTETEKLFSQIICY